MSASSRKDLLKELLSTNAVVDPGKGPGGPGPPFFLPNWPKKILGGTAPPRLSKDLDDRAPSLSQGLELVTGTGHPLKPDPLNHVNTGQVIHARFQREQSFIFVSFFNQRHLPTKAVRELKQQRAVQFRSVAEIAPKSPFLCVNRIKNPYHIRYNGLSCQRKSYPIWCEHSLTYRISKFLVYAAKL